MTVKVVTTLHKDGYNLYGKQFLSTWAKYFPEAWEIDYYAEDHDPVLSPRIKILDFKKECTDWIDYYEHVKKETQALDQKADRKTINRYKKALRWSFKMFTLLHALKNNTTRYLIWMDADVYATTTPSSNWIEKCLRKKCIAGQLEFVKGMPHVETGILIIDLKHPDIPKLISWIEEGYINKKILLEPKPWDGIWMGKLFEAQMIECNILKMAILGKNENSVARAFSDPILFWLTHQVGDHKFSEEYSGRSGRTAESELI